VIFPGSVTRVPDDGQVARSPSGTLVLRRGPRGAQPWSPISGAMPGSQGAAPQGRAKRAAQRRP
jgi:hypothetical protein